MGWTLFVLDAFNPQSLSSLAFIVYFCGVNIKRYGCKNRRELEKETAG